MDYKPPFSLTDEMMSLVADVAELIGHLSADQSHQPSPRLRKENRIKTIQSSLAIENNSLTIEQVTAIIEGKRVLGAPNEIQEVKNALDAYELLLELNPYKEKDLLRAHRLMMTDLVNENGRYRSGGVGIFDGQKCVHIAPPAERVPLLMSDLLQWVHTTKTHPLISSCVFHTAALRVTICFRSISWRCLEVCNIFTALLTSAPALSSVWRYCSRAASC